MINGWNQFPFVLRRKILFTLLAGAASMVVSMVVFVVIADWVLLILGGIILVTSLILGQSLWATAARGQYEIVDGICTGVSTHMLCRYRKVHLTNEQGGEQTLLINKSSKFQLGVHYRFYFQKSNHLVIGNDYLDAALSTNNFLGFEIVDGSSATDGLA